MSHSLGPAYLALSQPISQRHSCSLHLPLPEVQTAGTSRRCSTGPQAQSLMNSQRVHLLARVPLLSSKAPSSTNLRWPVPAAVLLCCAAAPGLAQLLGPVTWTGLFAETALLRFFSASSPCFSLLLSPHLSRHRRRPAGDSSPNSRLLAGSSLLGLVFALTSSSHSLFLFGFWYYCCVKANGRSFSATSSTLIASALIQFFRPSTASARLGPVCVTILQHFSDSTRS